MKKECAEYFGGDPRVIKLCLWTHAQRKDQKYGCRYEKPLSLDCKCVAGFPVSLYTLWFLQVFHNKCVFLS